MSENYFEQCVLNRWNRKIEDLPGEHIGETDLYEQDLNTRLSYQDTNADLCLMRINQLTDSKLDFKKEYYNCRWLDYEKKKFILYADSVPFIESNGIVRANRQIRLYMKGRAYGDNQHDDEVFGWQLLSRKSKNEEFEVVESKDIVKPSEQFVDFICGKIVDTGVDSRRSRDHKKIFHKDEPTIEQKMGYLSAMKEFDRVHLPLIEQEMMEHLAVAEMYSNGIDFVHSLKEQESKKQSI